MTLVLTRSATFCVLVVFFSFRNGNGPQLYLERGIAPEILITRP